MSGKEDKVKKKNKGAKSVDNVTDKMNEDYIGVKLPSGTTDFSSSDEEPKSKGRKRARIDVSHVIANAVSSDKDSFSSDATVVGEKSSGIFAKPNGNAPKLKTKKMIPSDRKISNYIARSNDLNSRFLNYVNSNKVADEVVNICLGYQKLISELSSDNDYLNGRVFELRNYCSSSQGYVAPAVASTVPSVPVLPTNSTSVIAKNVARPQSVAPVVPVPGAAAASVPGVIAASVKKPAVSYAVVVAGKEGVTKEEMPQKLNKVKSELDVNVRGVTVRRDGSAIIRVPTEADRKKIMECPKFSEVGLNVKINKALHRRIMVKRVNGKCTKEDLMNTVFERNLFRIMNRDAYEKNIRIVTQDWNKDNKDFFNVVLECNEEIAEYLAVNGVCTENWNYYNVTKLEPVQFCTRCFSYDHSAFKCNQKLVCRFCGLDGHKGKNCPNATSCRNCRAKRWDSNHYVLSMDCPIYANIVARQQARF